MKANSGGQIDPESVIGRSRVIEHIWNTLEQQSIVITAERRIGKTTIIKKLKQEPASNWVPVFQDLEGCHTASEFATTVYKEVHQFLSQKGRTTRRVKEWLSALGGTEIGGLLKLPEKAEHPWKVILTRSIEDLVHENDVNSSRLLFLWDEVPFMLANIRDREGEQAAMEVLDILRALRQTHPTFRMIITGSIGLHHVLTSLKDKNYANAPVNDMARIEIEPLTQRDAEELAVKLIEGESLVSSDKDVAAVAIANEADRFPFYIHHIVRTLRVKDLPVDPDTIARVVTTQLVDSGDPWELRHYRDRIRTYYGTGSKAAIAILDELAANREKASVTELLAMLKASSQFDDREQLLQLLYLMDRDHYLQRYGDGCYGFRFPLIRRWWKIDRGL